MGAFLLMMGGGLATLGVANIVRGAMYGLFEEPIVATLLVNAALFTWPGIVLMGVGAALRSRRQRRRQRSEWQEWQRHTRLTLEEGALREEEVTHGE
jgi:hypothetical protein